MSTKKLQIITAIICLLTISWMVPFHEEPDNKLPERVKIALRQVGNELLLSNQDSTSIILPVIQLEPLKYQLSFEKELTFFPDSLVAILDKNFAKAGLPENYIVEVLRCEDREVSYSYEMNIDIEQTIVPCSGRQVPDACHTIEILFIEEAAPLSTTKIAITLFAFGILGLVVFRSRNEFGTSFRESKKGTPLSPLPNENYEKLGSFHFYPEQNKLVKEAKELPLSRKECELLAIFVARPNEIIKREELTKSVWEDNGVIVGRSLDTYISKLRKKLKEDDSIKIANVHGVGYRLEIN
ncbi:winged helix family transcriptional regulator [Dokdonia sinensis]|uniref:Winged helix family transcriptional regulator n=1 Tax=Dokdonia sinensis TaxID=2479847 RepID=A0A3M0GQG1_9FLAO|nr:winged helix-turn-helix domain-containing protein [Dokdonia sinensis]RMB63419.1 winged helix family transcriptional regulator [Dokdonia sinensis]